MNSKKVNKELRPQPTQRARARAASNAAATDEPRYQQIACELKRDIAVGVYPVGSPLPTKEELTKH
jgi:DNA-binding FadR family transcriptional regulator